MNCVNHPSEETNVSCSNCGDPICPDCMVYTPVGVKCAKCGRMPKSAMARVKPERVALSIIAGLGAGAAGGFIFGLTKSIPMISFFTIFIAFGLGAGVGEAISWASGRYHGSGLAVWAAACGVFGVAFGIWSVGFGFALSMHALTYTFTGYGIWGFIWMAAAGYGAWQRNA